jgi:DNA polymerase III subunit delta'
MSNVGLIYPWLQSQWQLMQASLVNHQLPNGLLLQGNKGLGKFDFAFYLAKTLLCTNEQRQACDACASCQLLQAGNHPDLFVLQPEQNSKIIKIDQVRQLSAQLNQTAQRGGYQVAIIYPAEAMNSAAANALLKTLEEPPGKVLLILIGHVTAHMPQTILSRCQKLAFNVVDNQQALAWLKQKIDNPDQAALLLSIANGAPLEALTLYDQAYLDLRDRIFKHLFDVYKHEINPIAPVTEYLKEDLMMVVMALHSIVMDMLRLQMSADTQSIVNCDCMDKLQWMAQHSDQISLHNLRTYLLKAQQWLRGVTHLNPQLLLESLLIRWKQAYLQQEKIRAH